MNSYPQRVSTICLHEHQGPAPGWYIVFTAIWLGRMHMVTGGSQAVVAEVEKLSLQNYLLQHLRDSEPVTILCYASYRYLDAEYVQMGAHGRKVNN